MDTADIQMDYRPVEKIIEPELDEDQRKLTQKIQSHRENIMLNDKI